ncbi:MAG: hypothetical protein CME59_23025 [Halioglobus sp.]|nr:hypothetical protein [Halioglobus sp.]
MDLQPLILPILYLLGLAQGVFLALALFSSRRGSRKANVYLGLLTLAYASSLGDAMLDSSGLSVNQPWLRVLIWPKEFFFGPMLYLYTREICEPGRYPLRGRQWLHFLPAALHVALTLPVLLLPPRRQYELLLTEPSVETTLGYSIWHWLQHDVEVSLFIVHLTIYLALSLRCLKEHRRRIGDTYSYTERIDLNWLRLLIIGTAYIYGIWLFKEFLSNYFDVYDAVDQLLSLSMLALIYSMGFMGLRQPSIFAQRSSQDAPAAAMEPAPQPPVAVEPGAEEAAKYRNSSLSPDLSLALMDELETLMREQKPYLDGRLSLPQLAQQLGVSTHYLSQTINEQRQQNFFDYVNGYRIESARRALRDSDSTILDIAMASGFNSKSAFYTAFRKHCQLTPSQYRQQNR